MQTARHGTLQMNDPKKGAAVNYRFDCDPQPMAEMAHRVHCSRHVMQMLSYKSNKATPIPLSSAQCSSIHTAAAAAAGLLYNGCTLLKELNGRPSILQQYNHVRRDPASRAGWLMGLLAAASPPDGRQSRQPVRVHYAIKNFGHDVVCIYTPRESLENVSSCFPTWRREREPAAAVHITDSV